MPDIQKGINIVLKADNEVLGGQMNASLSRTAKSIDITNKIDAEWSEYLTSIKSWRIDCGGIYVKNDVAYEVLQNAFLSNSPIDVEVILDDVCFYGRALIIDFPLNATFNSTYKYNVRLLGDGELKTNDISHD